MPFAGSVSTKFAPKAFNTLRRSILILAGMVKVSLYPFAAATNANAMPVLPLVGSTIDMPDFSKPFSSASAIIALPIRHFTENAGLRLSILANTVAGEEIKRLMRIKGVLPIDSALLA